MSVSKPEGTQFYLTAATQCPYLEGQQERKMFTHLSGHRSQSLHQLLSDNGFRRSQNIVYRPSCPDCDACMSTRICIKEFVPSKRHRRIINNNRDLRNNIEDSIATEEQYELFSRYLNARHDGGGMTQMSEEDFQDMIEDSAVNTSVVEYRLGEDQNNSGNSDGQLLGVALTDNMLDGYSMVYSFFDPEMNKRSLGNFIILDHIKRAERANLDFVYLGYLIEKSAKMRYKSQFKPLQIQTMQSGWIDYEPSTR